MIPSASNAVYSCEAHRIPSLPEWAVDGLDEDTLWHFRYEHYYETAKAWMRALVSARFVYSTHDAWSKTMARLFWQKYRVYWKTHSRPPANVIKRRGGPRLQPLLKYLSTLYDTKAVA